MNVKSDRPTVQEALQRLEREISIAREQKYSFLKVIHGYGSTGAGGDIRIAVQARLQQLASSGEIGGCIFGEEWSKSSDEVWRLVQAHPELKEDQDLGRRNLGITVVML